MLRRLVRLSAVFIGAAGITQIPAMGLEDESAEEKSVVPYRSVGPSFKSTNGQYSYSSENLVTSLGQGKESQRLMGPVGVEFRIHRQSSNGNSEIIYSKKFDPCKNETGAWPETCPQGSVIFPKPDSSTDVFVVQHFIDGQTQPTRLGNVLLFEGEGKWQTRPMGEGDRILDVHPSGFPHVYTVDDKGCCSWSNESKDLAGLRLQSGPGQGVVIFDEWEMFKNTDFDVSFFVSQAKFNADYSKIVVQIDSTGGQRSSEGIRLTYHSDQLDDEGLQRKKLDQQLSQLPIVVVFEVKENSKALVTLKRAEFLEWVKPREFKYRQGGETKTASLTGD